MKYQVMIGSAVFDLPNYNFTIAEKLDRQETLNNGTQKFRDKCKGMYDLAGELIGKDNVTTVLGKFVEADPNQVNILYLEIIKAYNKPLTDYTNSEAEAKLDDAQIDKLSELARVFGELGKMTDASNSSLLR